MSYSSFPGIDISGSKFTNCTIYGAEFSKSNMTGCNFNGTDLSRSNFNQCNLSNADFRESKNYLIDPGKNKLGKAKFNYPGVLGLLNNLDITIE